MSIKMSDTHTFPQKKMMEYITWVHHLGQICRRCDRPSTRKAINSIGRTLIYSCEKCYNTTIRCYDSSSDLNSRVEK